MLDPFPPQHPRWIKVLAGLGAGLFLLTWVLLVLTGIAHNLCLTSTAPPASQEATCSRAILLGKVFQNRADNPGFAQAYFKRGIARAEQDRPAEATRDFQDTLRLLGLERGFDATQDLANASESVRAIFAQAQALDPSGKAYATWIEVLLKNE